MFTPVETSIGALLLHQATSVLLYQNGTILGASGYLRRFLSFSQTKSTTAFIIGMGASFLPLKVFLPELLTKYPPMPSTVQQALVTIGVGLLVGWGTKWANGCTSGHMLCGLPRLSARSTLAVATFFPVALISHHLAHPSLLTEACPGDVPCYLPTYPSQTTTKSLVLLTAITIFGARVIPRLVARLAEKEKEWKDSADLSSPARLATEVLAGIEFGLGLHITGMSSPAKVASFLSFPNLSAWDPSLGLVILFGVLPSLIENYAKGLSTSQCPPPNFNNRFEIPNKTLRDTDWKFVLGAAIFGVGWGLSGTCPGPAVLRAIAQPAWGSLWMGGFWLGGQIMG